MATLAGNTIAGFVLDELLGRGTTGETYAARVGKTGARVAVKLLHARLSLMDGVDGYWEQIERLATLSHPYLVVPSSSKWTTSGRFLMAMDLLVGLDLERVLERVARLPACQALRFAGQVCLALEAAHGAGVLHGAIKPRNIVLVPASGGFSTRVTDFATHRLLAAAQATGSAAAPDARFVAPESAGDGPSQASDVYALGAVLLEALGGSAARHGDGEHLVIPDEVPAGLRPVLVQALARDRAARWPSVQALRLALEKWASSDPAELQDEPVMIFDAGDAVTDGSAKSSPAAGVGGDTAGDLDGVRVAVDDLALLFEQEEPETVAANDPGSKRDVDHDQRSPDERELAAMAEQASAILQKNPQSTEPAPESEPAGVASTVSDVTEPRAPIMLTDPHGDTLDSEDTEGAEDHIDLPLERTVKAFVSTISPSIVADGKPGNNGESLELAFDQFVTEARALSTALPRPIVDDRQLAQLARIPAPEPAPVRPEPMAEPLPAPVALMPTAPEPPRRSVVPALVGGLLIGGLAVFAAVKLGVIPSTSVDATTQGFTPTTATRLDTGTPASASAGEVDQAAVTAASEDDAAVVAQPDQATATAATADTDTDTDTDADADADADADPAAATAVASPDARTAAAAVTPAGAKKARRTRAHQRPGPRKAAARQPRQPRPKTATPKAPKAKRSSDWVDPFSQ